MVERIVAGVCQIERRFAVGCPRVYLALLNRYTARGQYHLNRLDIAFLNS